MNVRKKTGNLTYMKSRAKIWVTDMNNVDSVISIFEEVTGIISIDPESSLSDLGIDSITLVEAVFRIEHELGVKFDFGMFQIDPSINDICVHLK